LVQHDDRTGAVKHGLQAGWRQRVGEQGRALMRDVAAKQMVKPRPVHPLGGHGPRGRQPLGERHLGFLSQQKATQAASGIGQRCGHSVLAIQPHSAAGSFRRRSGCGSVLMFGEVPLLAPLASHLVISAAAVMKGLRIPIAARPVLSLSAAEWT